MYNKCEVCGKVVGHELNTYKRIDEPSKIINGKKVKGAKRYYHMSCYRKLFEDKK